MGAAMNLPPIVSVVMPAFNAEAHLHEALVSVLTQSFHNFEVIVINDGSTDDTRKILDEFASDPRLRVIDNSVNRGLIASLHIGMDACRGQFVARMDADDICIPDRFERQVAFLDAHQEIDLVGGAIRFFGNVREPFVFHFPTVHERIAPAMLFYCPLAHPAVMFRRCLVDDELIRFHDEYRHAEDYHLWGRLLTQVRVANLQEVVLNYRLHHKQVSSSLANAQYQASLRVRKQLLDDAGVAWTDDDICLHESVILENGAGTKAYFEELARWFNKLELYNQQSGYWSVAALHDLLTEKYRSTLRRTGVILRWNDGSDEVRRYLDPEVESGWAVLAICWASCWRVLRAWGGKFTRKWSGYK